MKDYIDHFYEQLNGRCCCSDPVGFENFLLECIERGEAHDDPEYMVTVCGELGSFYRSCEQYDHSLAAFERAKTVAENAGAAETTLYAATLNNIAGTYRQMQDYDRAIDLYLKARKLYHNICGRTSAPYIGSLNNLSLAYREADQPELALSCLEEAVETYTKILGPDHERSRAAGEDLFHLRQKVAQMRAKPLTERSDDLRRTTE